MTRYSFESERARANLDRIHNAVIGCPGISLDGIRDICQMSLSSVKLYAQHLLDTGKVNRVRPRHTRSGGSDPDQWFNGPAADFKPPIDRRAPVAVDAFALPRGFFRRSSDIQPVSTDSMEGSA